MLPEIEAYAEVVPVVDNGVAIVEAPPAEGDKPAASSPSQWPIRGGRFVTCPLWLKDYRLSKQLGTTRWAVLRELIDLEGRFCKAEGATFSRRIPDIADAVGCSTRTVYRELKALATEGLIHYQPIANQFEGFPKFSLHWEAIRQRALQARYPDDEAEDSQPAAPPAQSPNAPDSPALPLLSAVPADMAEPPVVLPTAAQTPEAPPEGAEEATPPLTAQEVALPPDPSSAEETADAGNLMEGETSLVEAEDANAPEMALSPAEEPSETETMVWEDEEGPDPDTPEGKVYWEQVRAQITQYLDETDSFLLGGSLENAVTAVPFEEGAAAAAADPLLSPAPESIPPVTIQAEASRGAPASEPTAPLAPGGVATSSPPATLLPTPSPAGSECFATVSHLVDRRRGIDLSNLNNSNDFAKINCPPRHSLERQTANDAPLTAATSLPSASPSHVFSYQFASHEEAAQWVVDHWERVKDCAQRQAVSTRLNSFPLPVVERAIAITEAAWQAGGIWNSCPAAYLNGVLDNLVAEGERAALRRQGGLLPDRRPPSDKERQQALVNERNAIADIILRLQGEGRGRGAIEAALLAEGFHPVEAQRALWALLGEA